MNSFYFVNEGWIFWQSNFIVVKNKVAWQSCGLIILPLVRKMINLEGVGESQFGMTGEKA